MYSLLLASLVASQCTQLQTHKEWRELQKEEQKSYLQAVKCLRTNPSKFDLGLTHGNPKTRYDDFVYSHMEGTPYYHGTPQFLPWHRYFLVLFDKALKDECNYSGPLPYWDWTADSEAPEQSTIWPDLGGIGPCIDVLEIGQLHTDFMCMV